MPRGASGVFRWTIFVADGLHGKPWEGAGKLCVHVAHGECRAQAAFRVAGARPLHQSLAMQREEKEITEEAREQGSYIGLPP